MNSQTPQLSLLFTVENAVTGSCQFECINLKPNRLTNIPYVGAIVRMKHNLEKSNKTRLIPALEGLQKLWTTVSKMSVQERKQLAESLQQTCQACEKKPQPKEPGKPRKNFRCCPKCKFFYYCSQECFAKDWSTHKQAACSVGATITPVLSLGEVNST